MTTSFPLCGERENSATGSLHNMSTIKLAKCCTALFLLFVCFPIVEAQEKIRIGFYEYGSYHSQSVVPGTDEIQRGGYGYELLQRLKPYTDWEYEYSGFEDGWTAMLSKLKQGEFDMLTSVVKTPQREQEFEFSERPVGYSCVTLTVKAGNTRFHPHDYAHWSGMRIGVLKSNTQNNEFAAFAKEHGFTYQEVPFAQSKDMDTALQSGKVDALATWNFRVLHNEWVYEQIDNRPVYIVVRKGNKKLLNEVNAALDKLVYDDPAFIGDMQNSRLLTVLAGAMSD